jgi:hypothetical protein
MTPIQLLIRELPQVKCLTTSHVLKLPTLQWQYVAGTLCNTLCNRAAPLQRFDQRCWMIFTLFIAQMESSLALTKLDLAFPFCSKQHLALLLGKAHDLEQVRLEKFSADDLESILTSVGQFCHKVTVLELPNLAGVDRLDFSQLTNCRQLISLQVSYCAAPLEAAFLTWLGQAGGKLQSLTLSYCLDITDKTVAALGVATPFLTTLNLSGCPRVTSDALCSLKNVKRLWRNDIGLMAETVASHPAFFSQLEKLSVANCEISSETCKLLASSCTHLQHLDLRGNVGISFEAIACIVTKLSNLKVLNLLGISLTQEEIAQLAIHRTDLKVITGIE